MTQLIPFQYNSNSISLGLGIALLATSSTSSTSIVVKINLKKRTEERKTEDYLLVKGSNYIYYKTLDWKSLFYRSFYLPIFLAGTDQKVKVPPFFGRFDGKIKGNVYTAHVHANKFQFRLPIFDRKRFAFFASVGKISIGKKKLTIFGKKIHRRGTKKRKNFKGVRKSGKQGSNAQNSRTMRESRQVCLCL